MAIYVGQKVLSMDSKLIGQVEGIEMGSDSRPIGVIVEKNPHSRTIRVPIAWIELFSADTLRIAINSVEFELTGNDFAYPEGLAIHYPGSYRP